METYINYKGFGIRYKTFGGTTTVENFGYPIKTFKGYGEMKGEEAAKKYIDAIIRN